MTDKAYRAPGLGYTYDSGGEHEQAKAFKSWCNIVARGGRLVAGGGADLPELSLRRWDAIHRRIF
jgi:hypothetical protein